MFVSDTPGVTLILQPAKERTNPGDLRHRVAAACIEFATGAFPLQQSDWHSWTTRRVEVAEQWPKGVDELLPRVAAGIRTVWRSRQ